MSDATLTALDIIYRQSGFVRASEFARAMWPNSPAWNAASKARGLVARAGTFLNRLARDGLLDRTFDQRGASFHLTEQALRKMKFG